jgi:sugar lactone lactonase YvrE
MSAPNAAPLPGGFSMVEPGLALPVLPDRMQVGECPLWHPQQQCLYWVDIQSWLMPSDAAALAWVTDGLIVALRSGFVHLHTATDADCGKISPIADAPYDSSKIRCNDGKVDALGRFWVGTLYEPRDVQAAEMLCLERGQVRQVWQGGMTVSNGLAFTQDGRTLFHADTTSHQIRQHNFDLPHGTVGPARLLRQFSTVKDEQYGGRPDGAAIDSEGAYWCAMMEGGCLLRLAPDGSTLQRFDLPLRCPTMLAFGGKDFKTLYITSIGQNRPEAEISRYPLTGCVLAMPVSVAGLPEPAYRFGAD